eukprot:369602-Rhodomonas_salina.2
MPVTRSKKNAAAVPPHAPLSAVDTAPSIADRYAPGPARESNPHPHFNNAVAELSNQFTAVTLWRKVEEWLKRGMQ